MRIPTTIQLVTICGFAASSHFCSAAEATGQLTLGQALALTPGPSNDNLSLLALLDVSLLEVAASGM